jgi:hypothetical protein
VIGSLVWDEIHGRDPLRAPVEEWGGIAYALAALDAALPDDWEVVPIIKVGRDMAPQATELLRSFRHIAPTARCVEVPEANNRVVLRYETADALYVNFISGFELCLFTAESLRRGFDGPIYADLHSLFLGLGPDGVRMLRPLPNAPAWFAFFDVVQLNEEELAMLGGDPLAIAADALGAGVSLLNVTVGAGGVVYVARPGFTRLADRGRAEDGTPVRTARIPPPHTDAVDPTGCGDVFGATCCARLLAGDPVVTALEAANRAGARNATFRGARGLARHLRGELVEA